MTQFTTILVKFFDEEMLPVLEHSKWILSLLSIDYVLKMNILSSVFGVKMSTQIVLFDNRHGLVTQNTYRSFSLKHKVFAFPSFLKQSSVCINFSLSGHFGIIIYISIPLVGMDTAAASVVERHCGKCSFWSKHALNLFFGIYF